MQTASFGGFIKMIIQIALFYYAIKFLARIFMPYIIEKTSEKIKQNIENQINNQQQNNYKQKDGVIIDDSKVEKPKKSNDKVGEYVDFEEIK